MSRNIIDRELWRMIVGKKIGEGVGRAVYTHLLDPSLVIKIERSAQSFDNVLEWKFWHTHEFNEKVSRWLAPCVAISANGAILMQRRMEPLQRAQLPDEMPMFIGDYKLQHMGMFEGRVVVCDYAWTYSRPAMRMQRVNPEQWG